VLPGVTQTCGESRDPGEQNPTIGQANATTPPYHHHHAADATSNNSSTSTAQTAASDNMPDVPQTLTADMMRALQAYASSSSAASSIGLTV